MDVVTFLGLFVDMRNSSKRPLCFLARFRACIKVRNTHHLVPLMAIRPIQVSPEDVKSRSVFADKKESR